MVNASLRRTATGVADQGLYSALNLLLTVLVARVATPAAFGAFGTIYVAYLILASTSRGLTSETLLVAYSAAGPRRWRRASEAAGGVMLALGLVAGAGLVVVGKFALSPPLSAVALATGVCLPALLSQDFMRFAAFARGRPTHALANDASVAVMQIALVVILALSHHETVTALIWTWGAANLVGATVGCVLLRVTPDLRRATEWLARNGALAYRYAADNITGQTAQQSSVYVVAAAAGLSQVAALRGALTVFGPLWVVAQGIVSAVTPEFVRLLDRAPAKLPRQATLTALVAGAFSLSWAAVVLIIPSSIGHQLFGATWDLAQPLLIYVGVAQIFTGAQLGYVAGLRALGAAPRSVRARLVVSALALAATVPGAVLDGARGVVVALLIVAPIQTGVWWYQFRRASSVREPA